MNRSSFGAIILLCSSSAILSASDCVTGVVIARQTGTALSGATLHVAATETTREVPAQPDGAFALAGLASGRTYSVTASAPGFQPAAKEVVANCEAPQFVRFELELAQMSETVTVEDRAVVLRGNTPEISQTVTTRQLQDLPSNGRSVTRVALLNPHVRNTAGQGGDGSAGARLSINAASFRHTSYSLDGASNYDGIFANAPQQNVSLSAVRELRVLTNQYSAEYGTTSAGIVLATTKSGTNEPHGEVFTFVRPSGIQAAPPVSPFRVPNQRLQSGAAAGAPLVRDRTWLFGSFENVGQNRGSFIQSPEPRFYDGRLDEFMGLLRADQRWGDSHTSSLRVNFNRSLNNNVNDRVGGFTQPSAAQRSMQQGFGLQANDQAMIGDWFNELRFSYTNYIPSATSALEPQVSVVRPNYSTEGGSANSWVRAQNYQVADTTAVYLGGHSLKIGVDYLRQFVKDYSFTPFGEYRFAAGAPQPGQRPQSYTQTFGQAFLRYGQTVASAFVQDDWKANSRLTVNAGLRYDYQSLTGERNNFAPRVGLAWALTSSGDTTLRAGAGLFYDQYYMYITRRFYLQGVNSATSTYTLPFGAPGFPAFPESLAAAPTGVAAGKRDLYLPASQLQNPYALQYSLGLQHRISDWVITVDAIHQHTVRQMRANDVNHPAPFLRTQAGQRRSGSEADATRPMQMWAGVPVRSVIVVDNSGSSLYDALDFGLMKRFNRRYQVEAHYVYSSSAAYSMFFGEPNTGLPSEWNDTGRAERGPSDFHQRHRMVANGFVELPKRTQLSLIATIASGLPVNPTTGVDNNGDTYTFDRPVALGRNSYRGPMQAQLDASVSKRWAVFRERAAVELRGEVFNVFNRNNYIKVNNVWGDGGVPNRTFLSPVAGISNSDPSRQFQVAARFSF